MDLLRNIFLPFHKPNILKQNDKKAETNINAKENAANNKTVQIVNDNNNKIDFNKNIDQNKNITDEIKENELTDTVTDNLKNMTDRLVIKDMTKENLMNDNNTSEVVNEITNIESQNNNKDLRENDPTKDTINKNTDGIIVNVNETLDNSLESNSKLNTTVIIGDIVITNEIDEVATKYLNELYKETRYLKEFNDIDEEATKYLNELDDIERVKCATKSDKVETKANYQNEYYTNFLQEVSEKTENLDILGNTEAEANELQEFDEHLAKLTDNSQLTIKHITLDEIYDILDLDNDTHNFQEIKYTNGNTYDGNNNEIDFKNLNNGNRNMLSLRGTKDLTNEVTNDISEEFAKDNSEQVTKDLDKEEIISISSDSNNEFDDRNSNATRDLHNDVRKVVSEEVTNNLFEKLTKDIDKEEIISISSDSNNEFKFDDSKSDINENEEREIDKISTCSYHSSDFEFITEREAEMDGLIINFHPDRHGMRNVCEFGENGNSSKAADAINMQDYVVPENDDYLKLFEGQHHAQALSEIRFLENKSLIPSTPMYVQYEEIGFDMNLDMPQDNVDDEYRDEAKETLKKIIDMYPENKSCKRRRKF